MAVTQRDTQRHTYGDYLKWSRDYGDEIIDGVAYVREPPSPSRPHQELVVELSYQIRCALEGTSCRVYVAPFDIRLPRSDESDEKIETVVQPDVFTRLPVRAARTRGDLRWRDIGFAGAVERRVVGNGFVPDEMLKPITIRLQHSEV